ncbi:MAG: DNA repair protein RecO [Tepidisphaeraceae bacterium]|jgi:DNA repair protein RecO (recombination protein O)
MGLVNDRCICLRKFEYSETSQILTLFARQHGLIRVIAKGAHRVNKNGSSKFGGGIDLLDVGDATFTDRLDKDLATLTEWKLHDGHRPLRSTLRGLYLGFYAAELASLLFEQRDPHPAVFDHLEQLATNLATPRIEQAFLAFELNLLGEAGYLPELSRCVSCGSAMPARPGPMSFSADHGGVLCGNCESAFPARATIDGRLLGVIQIVLNLQNAGAPLNRLPVLTRHQTDPINRLLAGHMQHILGRPLRMRGYVA